jgi:Domain of unknown function (DUF4388)
MLGVRVMEEKMAIAHAISTTERLALILPSITLNQRTGCLSLELATRAGYEKGEIFFVNGYLVRATTRHESGRAAISRMLNWREVSYAFFPGMQPLARQSRIILHPSHLPKPAAFDREETLETPSLSMALVPTTPRRDTLRLPEPPAEGQGEDLSAQVAENMGSRGVLAIFRAHPHATTPSVLKQLERRERIVLLLLNGKRTLREVARLVHRSELDIARVLVRMLKQGYVEFMGA